MYLIALGAGVLVGIIYALMHVRSPAPPVVALLGLLGMLIGEQLVPIASRILHGEPLSVSWFRSECVPKITGIDSVVARSDKGASPSPDA